MINNNNDDYLWDQSGEPDPEIQELEQVLGTLRYQPRPLEIPLGLQPERRHVSVRGFAPRLAIAAAIALVVLGAGFWLSLQRRDSPGVAKTPAGRADSERAAATVTEDVVRELNPPESRMEQPSSLSTNPADKPSRKRFSQAGIAGPAKRKRDLEVKPPELTAYELREAEAGKARLMLALRVASAKLNFAIKKAQGNQGNLIQNQHKVG